MNPQRRQIAKSVSDGLTYAQTAKLYGVTRNTVAGICKRMGVKVPGGQAKGLEALANWKKTATAHQRAERIRKIREARIAQAKTPEGRRAIEKMLSGLRRKREAAHAR
jgi:hypothetical protein